MAVGKELILQVDAGYFVAGAIWRFDGTVWHCHTAAPILKWMVGKSAPYVEQYMRYKEWHWTWVET